MKRYFVERTYKAEREDRKTRVRKQRVAGRIHGMKYCSKGHKDRNRHKNRIKRSGQARLVYVIDINHNIPTTWKWARGDTKEEEERKKERMEDRKKEWMICTLSFVAVDPDLLPLTPVLQKYARRIIWGEGLYLTFVCYLFVSWCFEPSQPVGIISGLKTNSIPSLSYSAHQSFNTNHNVSKTQVTYFTHIQTHIHLTRTLSPLKWFCVSMRNGVWAIWIFHSVRSWILTSRQP